MAGEVKVRAGGNGTPSISPSRWNGDMPDSPTAASQPWVGKVVPGDAGQWLQGQLLAERAAIIQLLECRHGELMREFCAQFAGEMTGPRLVTDPEVWSSGSRSKRAGRSTERIIASKSDSQIIAKVTEPEEEQPATDGIDVAVEDDDNPYANVDQGDWTSLCGVLKGVILSVHFEVVFGVLIILNTLVMAIQQQYEGFRSAYEVQYRGETRPADEVWPGAAITFEVLELAFGSLFTIEVILKMLVLGWLFLKDKWNVYDTIIVGVWLVDTQLKIPFDPMVLRLARILRLLRLLRILKWMNLFDPLILMVKAIKSSASLLAWSMCIMGMVTSIIAMVVSQLLEKFIRDPEKDIETRVQVFQAWGSFSRSIETMLEITLANWGPHCQLLMNKVSEWWLLFFVFYKFTIGFAVVQVLVAVFIQQTFKVASRDEEVMIKEKMSAAKATLKHLEALFTAMDSSGDGFISKDEFEEVLSKDQRIKMWFSALDVDSADVEKLFDLLDDGDGEIAKDEFLQGVSSCKGAAKVTDVLGLLKQAKATTRQISSLGDKIDQLSSIQSYQALTFNSSPGKAPHLPGPLPGIPRDESHRGDPWQGGEWQCNVSEADQG